MKPRYIQRIICRRKELKLSQAKFAEKLQIAGLDVSRSWVNNLERGERRLDPERLAYIAAALDTDPNWLLGWETCKKR